MELVKLRQEDDSEFKANLGYIVSLRSAYAKEQDSVSQTTPNQKPFIQCVILLQ